MDLKDFIGKEQFAVMRQLRRSEEGEWFRAKLAELEALTDAMPRIYGQEGLGDRAVVHLHYFTGSQDWYITERDTTSEQHQAFGLADFGDGFAELGYISIAELIRCGAELDLHWTPCTLGECRRRQDDASTPGHPDNPRSDYSNTRETF